MRAIFALLLTLVAFGAVEAKRPSAPVHRVMSCNIRITGLPADEVEQHEKAMLDYATECLMQIDGMKIYGTTEGKSPIISFNVEGCDHYDIGMILDKMGVAVRTGHHCAEPVMARYATNGVVRASIALYTNKNDIDALVAAVKRAVAMLK
jgi:cysteine desulfurase/selenocysteine lyase